MFDNTETLRYYVDMDMKSRTCERCGKKHLGTFVWLELNNRTGHYATPGRVPEGESQGLFAFGKTCAYRALGHERLDDFRREHPESFTANGKPRW